MTQIELATLAELTGLLKLSKPTIYRLIQRDGFPPPLKFGGSSRWALADVRAWIAARGAA